MSSKYYDMNKLDKYINNYYDINNFINKKLKEGSTMSRNQWILDHDKDYKDRWYSLMTKIDNLNLTIEEKFDLACSIERIIDKAMTLSSSQTEIDRTAWRKR